MLHRIAHYGDSYKQFSVRHPEFVGAVTLATGITAVSTEDLEIITALATLELSRAGLIYLTKKGRHLSGVSLRKYTADHPDSWVAILHGLQVSHAELVTGQTATNTFWAWTDIPAGQPTSLSGPTVSLPQCWHGNQGSGFTLRVGLQVDQLRFPKSASGIEFKTTAPG